ncbi:MAG: class I SAM-dependent methyltransferase [Planctomycetota bacterium]
MNRNNRAINLVAIEELGVSDGDSVLEVGPANGEFLSSILRGQSNVTYTGVDWSAEKVDAANTLHARWVESGRAKFIHGDSQKLPFEQNSFSACRFNDIREINDRPPCASTRLRFGTGRYRVAAY